MSNIRAIRTEADCKAALARIDALMDAELGTPQGEELDVLTDLVELYESKQVPMTETVTTANVICSRGIPLERTMSTTEERLLAVVLALREAQASLIVAQQMFEQARLMNLAEREMLEAKRDYFSKVIHQINEALK